MMPTGNLIEKRAYSVKAGTFGYHRLEAFAFETAWCDLFHKNGNDKQKIYTLQMPHHLRHVSQNDLVLYKTRKNTQLMSFPVFQF